MKKLIIISILVLSVTAVSRSAKKTFFTISSGKTVRVVEGEILIKFKRGVKERANFHKSMGVSMVRENKAIGFEKVKIPAGKSIEETIEKYQRSGKVEYAEPNYIYTAFKTPSDAGYSKQWGLRKINAPGGWDITTGGNVTVAILDSGIDYNHEDIKGNMWINPDTSSYTASGYEIQYDTYGWDFVNDDNDPDDDYFHGTHVAGIAGAVTDNGTGIAGTGWKSQLMAVKVIDSSGGGNVVNIIDGIIYAADNGADIINMSFGEWKESNTLKDAINYAYRKGVFQVAASGNSDDYVLYPAADDNVMAVGATDENDNRASFSNYGTQLDVMAPGINIYSTIPDGYDKYNGTSMASPFAAGLATLIISYWEENNIYYIPRDIKNLIIYGCDDIGAYGRDDYTGHGRINAETSLTLARDGVVKIDEEKSIVYPNPFNPEKNDALFIMPADTSEKIQELNIYDLAGEKVRTYSDGGKRIFWDGKNNDGKLCSSGLYYYYMATSAGSQKGKVTLLR